MTKLKKDLPKPGLLVNCLSTVRTNNEITKRIREKCGHRTVSKPVMIEDYNQNMAGVDIMDQCVLLFIST